MTPPQTPANRARVDPAPPQPSAAAIPDIATDPIQRPDPTHRLDNAPETRPLAAPTPTETAHRIASQIAPGLDAASGPGFDLALQPEELGHVRLKLVSHEAGSLLIVHADRPETLDLMRRHIGTLEADLRALGHDQLSLRFSGGGQQGMGGQMPGHQGQPSTPDRAQHQTSAALPEPPAPPAPSPAPTRARDHLDLRL
jgi:Flagellar hook-length control protein FliK.